MSGPNRHLGRAEHGDDDYHNHEAAIRADSNDVRCHWGAVSCAGATTSWWKHNLPGQVMKIVASMRQCGDDPIWADALEACVHESLDYDHERDQQRLMERLGHAQWQLGPSNANGNSEYDKYVAGLLWAMLG